MSISSRHGQCDTSNNFTELFLLGVSHTLLPGKVDVVWQVVVQVGESDFVLCPDGLTDDDLVDVIELIPVFISVGETLVRKNVHT